MIVNPSETFDYQLPTSYVPKITKIGKASEKIYVVEGTRYLNGGGLSFNPFFRQIRGGNLMITGPFIALNGDPYNYIWQGATLKLPVTPTRETETYAYRHKKKMNVVFFDGHVETLPASELVHTRYYWPRGTKVTASGQLTGDADNETNLPEWVSP